MSTHKTPNLHLHSWEATDTFSRGEFNDNFTALDAYAGANDARVAALERASNVRIVTGTYVGTGEYGSSHPNTLSFDGKLLRLTVVWVGVHNDNYHFTFNAGCKSPYVTMGGSSSQVTATWTENSVSWYHSNSYNDQFNIRGSTYRYYAVLAV